MKKYILFLALAITGSLFAQNPATGTTKAGKYQMNFPDLGTKADSVVLWNGTDKILKYIPASVFSKGLQGTLEIGSEAIFGNPGVDNYAILSLLSSDGVDSWNSSSIISNADSSAESGFTHDVSQYVISGSKDGASSNLGISNGEFLLQATAPGSKSTLIGLETPIGNSNQMDFPAPNTDSEQYYFGVSVNGVKFDSTGNAVVSGGGATNLSYTPSPTDGTVNSDTGTDATIPATDSTNAGLFLPAEKTKLAGIASGATANTGTVTTVSVVTANGVTGSVANATTTPAITLSLGAITPTTVVASGNVTAPNIDSTNKTDIAARAPIASPTFTGTVTIPSAGLSVTGSSGSSYFLTATGAQSGLPFMNTVRDTQVGSDVGANTPVTATTKINKAFWDLQKQVDNILTNAPFSAVNSTTVALTKAALNTAYPNVPVGYTVQASSITTGAMIYIKNSEAGSSDVWLSVVATVTP